MSEDLIHEMGEKPESVIGHPTPCPWRANIARLSDNSINAAHVVAANGNSVAQISIYDEETTITLLNEISATPDTLAALHIANCWLDHLIKDCDIDTDTSTLNINVLGPEPTRTIAKASLTESLVQIRAALAKATGTTP